ncbi:HAD family hydrolase [Mycoplasmopsis cynos]|uniref:HAD family hydrolase n=1 Tax=Mycoplasmopsis cynos TaxID=171284 RepID=A0ABD8AIX5_9BACT|nr:HAD family hydrolase [Mycoplasmopsis cynos]MCU9935155.1 Cof-type HAD-IIB family hydrolase [Mycoplasmopsis cynos]UWV86223.1 Cof-type HAD-IIB family hydrolase [Mycoplasmopsis cynos]WAM05336.1 Cof-type HAD-IIB family hydrolase [Mycoplasmopsis cynos]WAM08611.1 Cof-type HAD-IIB family hydrolase [Mycoplasmopsis cynos]WQQ19986.1 HAD family hydrolase [Mycoplasmopsis cynos]
MKRAFVFDLDGTLLTSQNRAHPNTIEALKKLRELKHINIIATGRGLISILPLLENRAIDHIDYIICSNGTLIYNVKTKNYELLGTLDPKIFEIVYEKFIKFQSILRVDAIKEDQTIFPNNQVPEWLKKFLIMDTDVKKIGSEEKMRQIVYNPNSILTQMALRNDLPIAREVTDELREELKNYNCDVFLTNSVYTDINPKGVSKLNALKHLSKKINVKLKNMYAFGDSGNDVDMLKGVGYGVAMGNATDEAMLAAKEIINHHNSDTIARFIKKILNDI